LSSLSDRIETLKKRAAEIASEVTSLADKRKSYSISASANPLI
jgi:hypothetical protein